MKGRKAGQDGILYLSHLDWASIRQRPQLLAEALVAYGLDLDARYLPAWRSGVRIRQERKVKARPLPHLPPVSSLIRWNINPGLRRTWLLLSKRGDPPGVVWLTHPMLLSSVPKRWHDRLLYDAMDLHAEFPGVPKERIQSLEKTLIERASWIFASSDAIAQRITEITDRSVTVIRNAVDLELPWPTTRDSPPGRRSRLGATRGVDVRVMYVGTVAEWFDLEAIKSLLEYWPDAQFEVVGPCRGRISAELDRLGVIKRGIQPHQRLIEVMSDSDVLVMPFKITELTLGVDPVKLYEYVAMGKPVVSVWYPGLAHFSEYVTFYNHPDEFGRAVVKALNERSRTIGLHEFLTQNSWGARAAQVAEELKRR